MKTPKLRSVYEETNRVAEKWSKIGFLLLAVLTPLGFVFWFPQDSFFLVTLPRMWEMMH